MYNSNIMCSLFVENLEMMDIGSTAATTDSSLLNKKWIATPTDSWVIRLITIHLKLLHRNYTDFNQPIHNIYTIAPTPARTTTRIKFSKDSAAYCIYKTKYKSRIASISKHTENSVRGVAIWSLFSFFICAYSHTENIYISSSV